MFSTFETQVLHLPYQQPDAHSALAMPVYHCAAYEFPSAEAMEEAFAGRVSQHVYSRITNPTVEHFERIVEQTTGALSVTALASGMAAISNVLFELAYAGANIVTTDRLFGNTLSLFRSTAAAFGIEARFCDLTDPAQVEAHIDDRTCMIFAEIITNPQQVVVDLKALSALARRHRVPLVADTTIIPIHLMRARELGIDLEVVSSTKYISGGGTSLGGLIIDHGTFDWSHSPRLAQLAATHGPRAFTEKLRKEIQRNLGACMSPHAAYMQTLGLATMPLRYERQATSCLELARALQTVDGVVSVNYTGLEDNPYHALSTAQFGSLPGAMLTFDLASKAACYRFLNRLKVIHRATNLFENRTLAIHPASTIFVSFTPEQRREADVRDTTIRLSLGLEPAADLLADIVQALRN